MQTLWKKKQKQILNPSFSHSNRVVVGESYKNTCLGNLLLVLQLRNKFVQAFILTFKDKL